MKSVSRSILLSVLLLAILDCQITMTMAFSTGDEVDVEKAFAESTFPIKPDDLIARAKEVLLPDIALGIEDGGACLADDFEFVAAVVGPIGKEEYLNALGSFKLEDSFDITSNFFGFIVSPMQTNRVYFFSQQTAKQIASFAGKEPDDDQEDLILPPQVHHIDFDDGGKLKDFGFYTVDRRYGNTGGLGGAFAYFYGIGRPLPIPECKPFRPSLRFRTFNLISGIAQKFQKKKEEI